MLIFLRLFAATAALAARAENIAKLRRLELYWQAFTSSRLSNHIIKT
jgi:hypothetical protein